MTTIAETAAPKVLAIFASYADEEDALAEGRPQDAIWSDVLWAAGIDEAATNLLENTSSTNAVFSDGSSLDWSDLDNIKITDAETTAALIELAR